MGLYQEVWGDTERCEAIFQKEDEEKAMKEAADAAATSAALEDEAAASSMNHPTTTVAGAEPMHVELPRYEAIPTTITGGGASSSAGPVSMEQAQFDVEIPEVTPKRSELEEMPESRKVRKINGLVVRSIDIVGAAQADYDDPRSSDDELKRKAAEESDAVHTHEGEPTKSFEVPVPERGVKSGVVVDPVKVQVARRGMRLWSFCGSAVVLSVWAVMDELVYVHPPRDMVPPGWCWKLRKSMYGTRRASRLWADYVRRVMEDDGSETIAVFSIVFVNRSKRYIVAVWGDDFAFTVASEMLPHLTELLERNFECRLIGNIGPGKSLKVVKLSNRQLAWTEQGFEWHADTKHSRSVLFS